MIELWRDIAGFEGLYQVSNQGQVRGIDRTLNKGRRWRGRILTQKVGRRGHRSVRLCKNNVHAWRLVHRLVLVAFVGPSPSPDMQGAHGDGDPSNNVPANLRWDTVAGNAADKLLHGTALIGQRNPLAKLTETDVGHIRARAAVGDRHTDIAADYSVTPANISSVVNRKTWSHLVEGTCPG